MKQDIAYQNKDIFSKIFAENLKEKSFAVYGIPLPNIKEVLPTNLPEVQANELRIDNLFLLEDNTLAIVDYESSCSKENKIKYLQYIIRVLKRYKELDYDIRMIVIYTADVEKSKADPVFKRGCLTLRLEQAFLSELDSERISANIKEKIAKKEALDDKELMEFIIWPLTCRGAESKKAAVREAVQLAKRLTDRKEQNFVLSGILVFSDKIIDDETVQIIKEAIRMTKVAEALLEEGIEKGIEKGIEQGIEQGREDYKRELINYAVQKGMTKDEIADFLRISIEEVNKALA